MATHAHRVKGVVTDSGNATYPNVGMVDGGPWLGNNEHDSLTFTVGTAETAPDHVRVAPVVLI